ncbi:uncharacterized protein LOC112045516 [Bicyclus anynana]|uniref:Uncharacterized protein LOC112045516 n=1 Tax=Bicyclus anynana TaxID=110368 RepID=A0ABM3M571_BICAN|nr:uncharacterized protein LOC112045516 [Bicyclus anynana]
MSRRPMIMLKHDSHQSLTNAVDRVEPHISQAIAELWRRPKKASTPATGAIPARETATTTARAPFLRTSLLRPTNVRHFCARVCHDRCVCTAQPTTNSRQTGIFESGSLSRHVSADVSAYVSAAGISDGTSSAQHSVGLYYESAVRRKTRKSNLHQQLTRTQH